MWDEVALRSKDLNNILYAFKEQQVNTLPTTRYKHNFTNEQNPFSQHTSPL